MRKPITIHLHEQVIAAINAETVKQERGFARVLENILSAHFGITGIQNDMEVAYAPPNARAMAFVPDPNCTQEENDQMAKTIDLMLEKAGY